MSETKLSLAEVDYLLTPKAIRQGSERAFAYTEAGRGFFRYHPEKLESTVDYVIAVIRENYPDLKIPFHSRWGHFRAGGVDRPKEFEGRLRGLDKRESARVKLDLVIPSVLLDAGAGAEWKFLENGNEFTRSEGLGVASYHMFLGGAFSGDGKSLRSDSGGLKRFSVEDLQKGFQVSGRNPLLGVEGRVSLIRSLGAAVEKSSVFPGGRPGNILDYLEERYGPGIPAEGILRAVLNGLGAIWPGRLTAKGVNLGDVWRHEGLSRDGKMEGLLAFHKLSQWLTYSLIEPLEESGLKVNGVENLTGLAEYRNGGLLLDSGLVELKDSSLATREWEPASDLILEWRALTVYFLDRIAEQVQTKLGMSPEEFPLARVLEGGTWWAGRRLAGKMRRGNPPLRIKSDGTVF